MSSSAKLLGVLIRPNKAVDECLQLFGGWGYMWEYPLARAYADTRIVKITGGSMEVMKQTIGRSLFKPKKK